MRQMFPSIFCCLLMHGMAWSADPPPPPTQQWLQVDSTGQFRLVTQATVCKVEMRTRTVTKKIPETKTVSEIVDGNTVTKNVTVYRDVTEEQAITVCVPVTQPILRGLSPESFQAFDVSGAALDTNQLRDRIGNGQLVLVSATEGRLPAVYSSLFRAHTVVIAFKLPKAPQALQPPAIPVGAEPQAPADLPLPTIPAAPAPQLVLLARQGVDTFAIRRIQEFITSVQSTLTITKGQVQEQISVPLQRTLRQQETTVVSSHHLRYHLDGTKDIPFDRIKEKLASELAVFYSSDGNNVDPFWLQNLKSTSLVVVGPQLPDITSGSVAPMTNSPQPVMPPASVPIPAPVAPK